MCRSWIRDRLDRSYICLDFDFTLKYVLGVRMGKGNRLSKRLDLKVGVKNDN